jgi:DNA-binding CsgD family transcriptional regulator
MLFRSRGQEAMSDSTSKGFFCFFAIRIERMLQNEGQQEHAPTSEPVNPFPQARIGDLAAMLRVMRPLNAALPNAAVGRRQLLADLCRFIGVKVGTLPPGALGVGPQTVQAPHPSPQLCQPNPGDRPFTELSPRMEETLRHLLDGDSEKQVARKLELSQHTIHVYVKAIYRRFGVSSRGELLARHLKK